MIELVSFVTRGKIRKEVLKQLTSPKTPTQISLILSTQRPTISRAILSLKNKDLVECLTPNEKMGRYYKITNLGQEVLKEINKLIIKGENKK